MMRMPTVPGVFAQSATVSATAGSEGSTGLISANRPGCFGVHLDRVARVVAVHGERRDQQCAIDADGIHRRHHVVARDFGGPVQDGGPGPAGVIALVGVHLGVDDGHTRQAFFGDQP